MDVATWLHLRQSYQTLPARLKPYTATPYTVPVLVLDLDRIRDSFYKAFEGQPADGSGDQPDAVTTATVSSRAMIDDVFGACRTVLGLPEVQAQLGAGTEATSDKPTP